MSAPPYLLVLVFRQTVGGGAGEEGEEVGGGARSEGVGSMIIGGRGVGGSRSGWVGGWVGGEGSVGSLMVEI